MNVKLRFAGLGAVLAVGALLTLLLLAPASDGNFGLELVTVVLKMTQHCTAMFKTSNLSKMLHTCIILHYFQLPVMLKENHNLNLFTNNCAHI